jgi:hypothetical protein
VVWGIFGIDGTLRLSWSKSWTGVRIPNAPQAMAKARPKGSATVPYL